MDALERMLEGVAARIPRDQLDELRMLAPIGVFLIALTVLGRFVCPWAIAALPGSPPTVPLLFGAPLSAAEAVVWGAIGAGAVVLSLVLGVLCWTDDEEHALSLCAGARPYRGPSFPVENQQRLPLASDVGDTGTYP
ncbi:hypothetical protein [Spongiactinospora sp. TRM90649]|uniref:hypothetical protein n=1 Tax=Spongiactinospora sp. TRM90649 TaxID=3031114 RepID=UPI0023F9A26C|nr:hypothetical protein [Spongiactinospora sp. TRM90649]MDF5756632.1 hypothetical protein [Spongiactinospora sp. TRM90649]